MNVEIYRNDYGKLK